MSGTKKSAMKQSRLSILSSININMSRTLFNKICFIMPFTRECTGRFYFFWTESLHRRKIDI